MAGLIAACTPEGGQVTRIRAEADDRPLEAPLAEADRDSERVGNVALEASVHHGQVEAVGQGFDERFGFRQLSDRDHSGHGSVQIGERLVHELFILDEEDAGMHGGHISARRLIDGSDHEQDGEADDGVAEADEQLGDFLLDLGRGLAAHVKVEVGLVGGRRVPIGLGLDCVLMVVSHFLSTPCRGCELPGDLLR